MGEQTRPERDFSPFGVNPITCPPGFEFAALLRKATAVESDEQEELVADQDYEEGDTDQLATSLPHSIEHPRPPASNISRSHKRRRLSRNKFAMEKGQYARPEAIKAHVAPGLAIQTALVTEALPVAKGGYSAKNGKPPGAQVQQALKRLVDEKDFEYIPWDGYQCRPLLDTEQRIYAVLAGQPKDSTYQTAARNAHCAILEEGRSAHFRPEEKHHRRGRFPALNVGVTYGKGTTTPVNINNGAHSEAVKRLLTNPDVQRLATFASASFAMWAPNVYRYYKEHLDLLWCRLSHLRQNFPKSIFPCAAFNFGPATCTYKHRDALNCPFGMCAIQALGNFDPKLGGHLILWEVKKVLEFPPGSLVLIPSATITHSNTPVQPGETRTSFTQFCAGGLFRYVDNGFQTEAELEMEDSDAYNAMLRNKGERWKTGLGLLSRLGDLVKSITLPSN